MTDLSKNSHTQITREGLLAHLATLSLPYDDGGPSVAEIFHDFLLCADQVLRVILKPQAALLPFAQRAIERSIQTAWPSYAVQVEVEYKISAHVAKTGLAPVPGVANLIAIASGKGGVGKSTTAVNVALALAASGARVGLLDADIYGPNQPKMLGIMQKPHLRDDKKLEPVVSHGLQTMSMGYLVGDETPMMWRGPMISTALTQLLQDTAWDAVDYVIVDLPPGTGDVILSLAQKLPLSAALMVTTPEAVAVLDVQKALACFEKTAIPVLGIIENMAKYHCAHCGHEALLFGEGGGQALADALGLPLLGQLPLDPQIGVDANRGCPTVIAAPESSIALQYHLIAQQVVMRLAKLKPSYAHLFKNISVENK
jgi:ATP-binding protein involved in chromosome partitioning